MDGSTSDHPQRSLEALGRRLEEKGLCFMPRAFFAPCGIVVHTPPVRHALATPPVPRDPATPEYLPEDILVIESAVFLYHSGESWEARVTVHGGPHWARRAETLDELEEVALEALRTHARPPSPSWFIV
jgi:hypothetical protein